MELRIVVRGKWGEYCLISINNPYASRRVCQMGSYMQRNASCNCMNDVSSTRRVSRWSISSCHTPGRMRLRLRVL
jgi:hypothetical protein